MVTITLKVIYLVHIMFLLGSTAPGKPDPHSEPLCEWILVENQKKAFIQAQTRETASQAESYHAQGPALRVL